MGFLREQVSVWGTWELYITRTSHMRMNIHSFTIPQDASCLQVCGWMLTSPRTVFPEEDAGKLTVVKEI